MSSYYVPNKFKHSDLLILYGTETGTSEDVAFSILNRIKRTSTPCYISSIDSYDYLHNLPEQKLVLFVVSTTGDGDVPTNMKAFWTFLLRKSLPGNVLDHLRYSVFGLGDSSYEKFNASAKRLSVRLRQLGAQEFCPIGFGDDQAKFGYFTALDIWLNIFLDKLLEHVSVLITNTNTSDWSSDTYEVQILSDDKTNKININNKIYNEKDIITLKVLKNDRMTSEEWSQDVRFIKLESSNRLEYQPGDVLEVFYRNPSILVEQMLSIITPTLSPDTLVMIKVKNSMNKRGNRIENIEKCTLIDLFQKHLDIGDIPKRSFFESLSNFASNPEEREKLLELSSPEGTDLFFDYCVRERRNHLEVLQDFKSARPPLHKLLEMVSVIAARQYSIASSANLSGYIIY